ncbi:hypothetical protein Sjap_003962 [Stephania japonica]|uniref:Uncharacterized protein n=1 Tax=Stephania japonica TaxID=461633 RepID=A0AAP0K282_9MAGN
MAVSGEAPPPLSYEMTNFNTQWNYFDHSEGCGTHIGGHGGLAMAPPVTVALQRRTYVEEIKEEIVLSAVHAFSLIASSEGTYSWRHVEIFHP